jgi:hypothetical protein
VSDKRRIYRHRWFSLVVLTLMGASCAGPQRTGSQAARPQAAEEPTASRTSEQMPQEASDPPLSSSASPTIWAELTLGSIDRVLERLVEYASPSLPGPLRGAFSPAALKMQLMQWAGLEGAAELIDGQQPIRAAILAPAKGQAMEVTRQLVVAVPVRDGARFVEVMRQWLGKSRRIDQCQGYAFEERRQGREPVFLCLEGGYALLTLREANLGGVSGSLMQHARDIAPRELRLTLDAEPIFTHFADEIEAQRRKLAEVKRGLADMPGAKACSSLIEWDELLGRILGLRRFDLALRFESDTIVVRGDMQSAQSSELAKYLREKLPEADGPWGLNYLPARSVLVMSQHSAPVTQDDQASYLACMRETLAQLRKGDAELASLELMRKLLPLGARLLAQTTGRVASSLYVDAANRLGLASAVEVTDGDATRAALSEMLDWMRGAGRSTDQPLVAKQRYAPGAPDWLAPHGESEKDQLGLD